MAGYSKNRETNYEMKYLRKVLGQVDKRVQIPESVSADSLRHLLDSVETPSVRETASRRTFKLSLQSGIAYAAAFALIVALFYSTRLYRPDIVSWGTDISAAEQQSSEDFTALAQAIAEPTSDATGEVQPFIAAETADAPAIDPVTIEQTESVADTQDIAEDTPRTALGVGGSGKATLVLEQDEYAFYWRENDLSDPDRTTPISFEIVDTAAQETVAQADVPLLAVTQSFELDNNIILVGNDFTGAAAICSYDVSDADGGFVETTFAQDGELLDARMYKDVVRIVSRSEMTEQDAELLPGCISGETYVITAFDPETQETVTKRFVGGNGTVQLHNLNAYIRYTGQDDDGETRDYVAQILFDGMDISLGTVS